MQMTEADGPPLTSHRTRTGQRATPVPCVEGADLDELMRAATRIGAPSMGADGAGDLGRRDADPGGSPVRPTPPRVYATAGVAE